MSYCPKCGTLVPEDATFCSNCGYVLRPQQPSVPPLSQSTLPPLGSSYPPARYMSRRYADYGLLCAILSLFIAPEIFGSAAIVLGAYAWKRELGRSNRGLFVLVLGIICMIVGIYFTSFFGFWSLWWE